MSNKWYNHSYDNSGNDNNDIQEWWSQSVDQMH